MNKIVISFDFELGWGDVNSGDWYRKQSLGVYSNAQLRLPKVVDFLDDRQVFTTWGVVSAMIEKSTLALDYDHVPRHFGKKLREFLSSAEGDSIDGSKIFESLMASPNIEIGSHSHTHMVYSESDQIDQALYDFKLSRDTIENVSGKRPTTFIFPENRVTSISDFFDIDSGLTFRLSSLLGRTKLKKMQSLASLKEFGVNESKIFTIGTNSVQTDSLLFNAFGKFHPLRKQLLQYRAAALLKSCRKRNNGVFHLWLHPCDLVEDPFISDFFLTFIDELCLLRDDNLLEFKTMEQMHKAVLSYAS